MSLTNALDAIASSAPSCSWRAQEPPGHGLRVHRRGRRHQQHLGGFVITDRMLKMFKSSRPRPNRGEAGGQIGGRTMTPELGATQIVIELLYLVASVLSSSR